MILQNLQFIESKTTFKIPLVVIYEKIYTRCFCILGYDLQKSFKAAVADFYAIKG